MQVSGRYRRIPYIWATVNIWYIAPSHQFLKSVLSVFGFWYISKCCRFLSRILLSINLNFGWSSYHQIVCSCVSTLFAHADLKYSQVEFIRH